MSIITTSNHLSCLIFLAALMIPNIGELGFLSLILYSRDVSARISHGQKRRENMSKEILQVVEQHCNVASCRAPTSATKVCNKMLYWVAI